MKEALKNKTILKEEKVGYLKTKMNLMQAVLYLTEDSITLDAHKAGVGGFGVLGAILKSKVESKSYGFNLSFNEIHKIEQGKHGVQKNVLEITTKEDEFYRIIVKDFSEWEKEIKQKM